MVDVGRKYSKIYVQERSLSSDVISIENRRDNQSETANEDISE